MTPTATATYPGIHIEYTERPRGYKINGRKAPSVTTVLGILDKPGIPHYAANETLKGVVKLARKRAVPLDNWENLKDALKKNRLGWQDETQRAQERGLRIHKIAEDYAEDQALPSASDFPEHERGYIAAFASFIVTENPTFLRAETLVGSATHHFAGRVDSVVRWQRQNGSVTRLDFKTSKRVYPGSHFVQLEAYELAAVECGERPTDARAVVRLGADGSYEVVESCASGEDFLAVLGAFRSQRAVEARAREKAKETK